MLRLHPYLSTVQSLLCKSALLWSQASTSRELLFAKAAPLPFYCAIFLVRVCIALVTGKYYKGGDKPPGPRQAIFSDDKLERVAPLIGLMKDIGSGHGGKTPVQVAINWVICKGAIPIVGTHLSIAQHVDKRLTTSVNSSACWWPAQHVDKQLSMLVSSSACRSAAQHVAKQLRMSQRSSACW